MNSNRVNITFHGIGEPPHPVDSGEARVWVSYEQFCGHLDSAKEFQDVVITFDDGNHSDIAIALPELVKRNQKAIFFVVSDRIGKPGYLGAEDILALHAAGMEIGSHGMFHQPWRNLSGGELEREIVEAKVTIEGVLGKDVDKAACPFGSYGRRSLGALTKAGFSTVYTSDQGAASQGEWLQARTTISRDHTRSLWDTLAGYGQDKIPAKTKLKRLIKRLR